MSQRPFPKRPALLRGGLSEGRHPSEFSDKQLLAGIKVEMEHTNNPCVAGLIAMDHLVEHPEYYTHLARMESRMSRKCV